MKKHHECKTKAPLVTCEQEVSNFKRWRMKRCGRSVARLLVFIIMLAALFLSNEVSASDKKTAAKEEANQYRQYLRSEVNRLERTTWLYSQKTPEKVQPNNIYAYLAETDRGIWVRVYVGVVVPINMADISVNDLLVKIDGVEHPVRLSDDRMDSHSRILGLDVLNYIDTPGTPELEDLLWKIANAKEVMIRCKGEKHYRDFEVSQEQKEALEHIRGYYKAKKVLGGTR